MSSVKQLFIIVLFQLVTVTSVISAVPGSGSDFSSLNYVDDSFISYTNDTKKNREVMISLIIGENFDFRGKIINAINEFKSAEILNSSMSVRMHQATDDYEAIREATYKVIREYEWAVSRYTDIELTSSKDSRTDFDTRNSKAKLIINPNDEKGKFYIERIKEATALALVLYDNFLLAIAPFQDSRLRPLVNMDNDKNKSILINIVRNAYNIDNIQKINKAMDFYKQIKEFGVDDSTSIDNVIQSSYFYSRGGLSWYDVYKARHVKRKSIYKDLISLFKDETMNNLSKFFSNKIVGEIYWDTGLMIKDKNLVEIKQTIADITSELKPMDVIMEKTPFRLTDKLIPGQWGHIAIWVGTEDDLTKLGVWDKLPIWEQKARDRRGDGRYNASPYVGKESFQDLVRSGHYIVEALRPGVQINTLEHFLNITDFAAIRPTDITDEERVEFLEKTFTQIGKEYDFNFNVETDIKIVCSEIVYRAFDRPRYKWPTKKTAGRHTISPDQVAKMAMAEEGDNRLFEPVMLFDEAVIVSDESLEGHYSYLLSESIEKEK